MTLYPLQTCVLCGEQWWDSHCCPKQKATSHLKHSSMPLPPLPDHPEPQIMKWSELEKEAITAYAQAAVLAERERIAKLIEAETAAVYAPFFARIARSEP